LFSVTEGVVLGTDVLTVRYKNTHPEEGHHLAHTQGAARADCSAALQTECITKASAVTTFNQRDHLRRSQKASAWHIECVLVFIS